MFRRILVPVDGTSGSEQAIPYAQGLAKALDAQVVVCHVITAPVAANSSGQRHQAAQYVTAIAERFRAAGVPAKTQVPRGDPPIEIKKAALDWNVDAIVMATRSRRRLEKLMLGSVADAVVRDCRLPVLLVSSRRQLKRPWAEARSSEPSTRAQAKGVDRVIRRLSARNLDPADPAPFPTRARPERMSSG